MKKILHFIQYHNFFSLAVMFIFVGASVSFAASPEMRQGVLAQTELMRSVDNSYVVNTNFDMYDMRLKIQSVTEDANGYYVGYVYNTVEVKDYVWQPVPKVDSIKVSKKELAWRDLGLYVADQLGQMVDQQIAYLKEVQGKEKKNGVTPKVLAVEYSGLIGQFLSTEEKTFEGYQPVKLPPPPPEPEKPIVVEVASVSPPASNVAAVSTAIIPAEVVSPEVSSASVVTPSERLLTREEVHALIQDEVKRLLAESQSAKAAADSANSPQADSTSSSQATINVAPTEPTTPVIPTEPVAPTAPTPPAEPVAPAPEVAPIEPTPPPQAETPATTPAS